VGDLIGDGFQRRPVPPVLVRFINEARGFVREVREPVDHLNLFGCKGAAVVEVRASLHQQSAIDPGLPAGVQQFIPGTPAVGLPIVDGDPLRAERDQVILGDQAKGSERC